MITVKELPSNYHLGYTIPTMRKFKFAELSLISSAVTSDYFGFMVKAIGNVIDVEIDKVSVGDLFYLMLLQRLESYKTPLYAMWTCNKTVYHDESGKIYNASDLNEMQKDFESKVSNVDPRTIKLQSYVCTHENTEELSLEDFKIKKLDSVPEEDSIIEIPRAGIYADVLALSKDSKLSQIASVAHWLKDGITLADKLEILEKQEDISMFEDLLNASVSDKYQHGVYTRVTKKCKSCGSEEVIDFNITPDLFLLK